MLDTRLPRVPDNRKWGGGGGRENNSYFHKVVVTLKYFLYIVPFALSTHIYTQIMQVSF